MILLLQGLLIIALAPLLLGWMKKLKAWTQHRCAPPLLQPYFDLHKLLCKQPVISVHASWLFKIAPYVYVACLTLVCFSVSFFSSLSLLSPYFDVIVIVGILSLSRIIMALAAMDIGTAFGSMGARRHMFLSCLVEPVLLLVFLNIALMTHTLTLNGMTIFLINNPHFYPGLIFSLCAFAFVFSAENSRIPFDNPATHLELTMIHEAMILEYSGRYLALIEFGNSLKFTLFLVLLIMLFIPFGLAINTTPLALIIGFASTLFKLFFCISVIAILEALHAKIRIFRIPEYLSIAFFLALMGIILTQLTGAAL